MKLKAVVTGSLWAVLLHAASPPTTDPPSGAAAETPPINMEQMDDRVKLKPGDRLSYCVLEDKAKVHSLTVSPTGHIDVPLIGPVDVRQQTCRKSAFKIKALLEKDYYQHATVMLEISMLPQGGKEKIYIYGQVRSPGAQDGSDGQLTLSRAILNAGGFAERADQQNVQVFRKNPRQESQGSITVDVGEILGKGLFKKDPVLEPGDYVLVLATGGAAAGNEKIYIYGQVRSPGAQDAGDGKLTLSRAILNAGGFSSFAATRKVKVFRKNQGEKKEREIVVDVEEILNKGGFENDILLEPGDYILVPEKMIRLF